MSSSAELARGWLLKGDSDRSNARQMVQGPGPYDTACFHTQQAVEKYLKALLAFHAQRIPPIHHLVVLYNQCVVAAPKFALDPQELADLTPYAVQLRYDVNFWPDTKAALQGLDIVERVRSAVLAILPPEVHPGV
jgi:HEPN domain-containing protein